MTVAGIISEYNPFHLGHAAHIEKTRQVLGGDSAIVCVMSGNYVQRGDMAVFNKHARATMAVLCGADLVVELPTPYALSSAEGFAEAGVHILDNLGICDYLSFGSESGDVGELHETAAAIVSPEAQATMKQWLKKGLSYASAQQKATDAVLGAGSDVLRSPNNLLGIEYIKALTRTGSAMSPMTVQRTGGAHDGGSGFSASALRTMLERSESPWAFMPKSAVTVAAEEMAAGRGPVFLKSCELAVLARLRSIKDFSKLPGATEGLDNRFLRYAASEPTVAAILAGVKTKRYTMSRLRRMLMCACLGITAKDTQKPPSYIRVLAMNKTGMKLLSSAGKNTQIPIINKPASVNRLSENAIKLFTREADATDFYVLAYPDADRRIGGQEWRQTPVVVDD